MEETKNDFYDESKMEGYYDGPDCMSRPRIRFVYNDYNELMEIMKLFNENNDLHGDRKINLPELEDLLDPKYPGEKEWAKNYRKMMLALHPDKNQTKTEEDRELNSDIFAFVQDINERLKCFFRKNVKLGGKKKSKKHRRKTLGNRRRQTSRR